jgi:hypothetical protein
MIGVYVDLYILDFANRQTTAAQRLLLFICFICVFSTSRTVTVSPTKSTGRRVAIVWIV